VSNTSGQLPHGLHLLGLMKLGLELFALFLFALTVCDVAGNGDN
jgi:hypothetical protein